MSELFPYGKWLLCHPGFYDVRYEINPWMSTARGPNKARALEQWQHLHHLLIRLGAWVEVLEPHPECPDICFTANAGLVLGKLIVLSSFMFKERQGEVPVYREWFVKHGYQSVVLNHGHFEGEGDALFAGKKLFGGYGFRSDLEAYDELATYLPPSYELVKCKLVDPRFYHLDTCFCPLNGEQALAVRSAFDDASWKEMEKHLSLIEVPEDEALHFACNSVVLGKNVVLPSGCNKVEELLKQKGFEPYSTPLDEYLKAGGSAKCLSLKVDRSLDL